MTTTQLLTAKERLDRDFLKLRHALLDVAAMLDRVERGHGAAEATRDPRWLKAHEALERLSEKKGDRAEALQMLFSDSYDPGWRTK